MNSFTATETVIPRGQPLPDSIEISHHFVGDSYAKLTQMAAGDTLAQHKHNRDHLSALLIGSAVVQVDGMEIPLAAPASIHIRAGKEHRVHAVTPVLWACIWSNPSGVMSPEGFDHEVIKE